ncbi:ATP-dependent DNA helicase PIF1 [Taenia solium]|eukprot:TsM_001155500 transcript=TsM_001155500 gene=TsM_001155500
MSACGPTCRTIKFEKAHVSLVKSDNSELLIRIKLANGPRKCLGYKVSNPKFFTRFMREGKSTISLRAVPTKRPHSGAAYNRSGVCSSTPVRNPKRDAKLAVRVLPLSVDMDKTFSHVLFDWQGDNVLKNGMIEQARAIESVKMGVNVLCTGGAGTGKSHLLRKLAAVTTRVVSDPRTTARWRGVRRIIIDEVSMTRSRVFTRFEAIARIALGKCDEKVPFGGIQIIALGDFFQLPPVLPVSAACIASCRKSGDIKFFHLLNEVREGRSPQWVLEALRSRVCKQAGTMRVSEKKDTGPKNLITESFSAIPHTIKLKVGAQVMLLRNLDVSRGLVNGVRGVVESFTPPSEGGFPVVRFFVPPAVASPASEKSVVVQPERWTANFGRGVTGKEVQATRLQLPLCLAWAISINRSQGITLDSVEVDLSKHYKQMFYESKLLDSPRTTSFLIYFVIGGEVETPGLLL